MKNKLFFKIFFGYLFLLFSIFVIFLFLSLRYFRNVYINDIKEILKNDAYLINETLKDQLKYKNFNELDKFIKEIAKKLNIRITVIDEGGNVISDSEKDPKLMENHLNRPEIQIALKEGTGIYVRYSSTVREDMIYFARIFEMQNKKYFIRTSYFLKSFKKNFTDIRNNILIFALIIFLISIAIIYFYSRSLYLPIKKLKEATKKVADGDFDTKVILHKEDEFKELADNFNLMTQELKQFFSEKIEKQKHLNTIISSIDDGIIAIDSKGKIVFVNNGFNKIFEIQGLDNRYYWEFLISPDLIKVIEDVISKKSNFQGAIEIKNRFYFCNATYLDQYEQAIIILHDISRIKEVEKVKKDLVANVSHELKTPLTAIAGFAETALETTKEKETKKYLEIIINNSKRLINIINDLLLLSNIENNSQNIQFSEVDLSKLFNNIKKLFEKRLKEKNLKFILNLDENNKKIQADLYMMEQVFINLIDNAIKYTEKGEIRINTYMKDKNKILIEVSDTGIGIPQEHIPRIFERFYVVDKSRSRESGGTGLGLSIVKHIINIHKGEILVDSKIGTGTKFIIILPVKNNN
jgi:two-component system phosphate regulon sensor histidine kinase PhoR